MTPKVIKRVRKMHKWMYGDRSSPPSWRGQPPWFEEVNRASLSTTCTCQVILKSEWKSHNEWFTCFNPSFSSQSIKLVPPLVCPTNETLHLQPAKTQTCRAFLKFHFSFIPITPFGLTSHKEPLRFELHYFQRNNTDI